MLRKGKKEYSLNQFRAEEKKALVHFKWDINSVTPFCFCEFIFQRSTFGSKKANQTLYVSTLSLLGVALRDYKLMTTKPSLLGATVIRVARAIVLKNSLQEPDEWNAVMAGLTGYTSQELHQCARLLCEASDRLNDEAVIEANNPVSS